jgi:hypothetical protein
LGCFGEEQFIVYINGDACCANSRVDSRKKYIGTFGMSKRTSQLPETVSCLNDGVTIVYAINADPLEFTWYSTLGFSSLEQEIRTKDSKKMFRIALINFI